MAPNSAENLSIYIDTLYGSEGMQLVQRDLEKLNKLGRITTTTLNNYSDLAKKGSSAWKGWEASQVQASKSSAVFNKQVQTGTKQLHAMLSEENRFKPLGLNFLFFGMFIERVFGGILRSGVGTFNEIMGSTEGATSALATMGAATEYLKFTLGDALNTVLEPLLPTLLAIVDAIANFIQQNPGLVTFGLVFATILGSVMLVGGVIKTFTDNVHLTTAAIKLLGGAFSEARLAAIGLSAVEFGVILIAVAALIIGLKMVLDAAKNATAEMVKLLQTAPPGGTPGAPLSQILEERRLQGMPMLTTPLTQEQLNETLRNLVPKNSTGGSSPFAGGGTIIQTPIGNVTIQNINVNSSIPIDLGTGRQVGTQIGNGIMDSIAQYSSTATTIR